MKIDRVFLWELAKMILIWAASFGATWAVCALASRWGMSGIAVAFGLAVLSLVVFVANLSAKQVRISRKIKP